MFYLRVLTCLFALTTLKSFTYALPDEGKWDSVLVRVSTIPLLDFCH